MKYHLIYKPVFSSRGELRGYDVACRIVYIKESWEGYEVISVEKEDGALEHSRIIRMLSMSYDPKYEVSFIDKHPVDLLMYIRGEKVVRRLNDDWKNQVDDWSVNLRGEKV